MTFPFRPKRLLVYVIVSDDGMAPNLTNSICTLALCKPVIRRVAIPEQDWVIGMSTTKDGTNKLIYAMPVTEKLSFKDYSINPLYQCKQPTSTNPNGDNIFIFDDGHTNIRANAAHALRPDKIQSHLSSPEVLISDQFWFFGKEAPRLPDRFTDTRLVQGARRGHKPITDNKICQDFYDWLCQTYPLGIHGQHRDTKNPAI